MTRLRVVAPVRCVRCRSRLTSKLSKYGNHVKWCRRCRFVVSYVYDVDLDDLADLTRKY